MSVDVCVFYMQSCMYLIAYSYKWQRLRAVQMFVEHLISKHDELEVYGKRLDFVS